jgi:hypothetical protein
MNKSKSSDKNETEYFELNDSLIKCIEKFMNDEKTKERKLYLDNKLAKGIPLVKGKERELIKLILHNKVEK